jgi:hypothetical protein
MLSGCGMCFSRRIVEQFGWTAFSVGEDWEYSATLLLNGETIHFNADARVMARESRGFQQGVDPSGSGGRAGGTRSRGRARRHS